MSNGQSQSASATLDDAKALYYKGKYQEAEQLCLKALELSSNQYGREHQKTLKSINQLARTYSRLRDNEKALFYFQEAYTTTNKLFGTESPESAYCLIDMGHVYAQMYEPDSANMAYGKALAIVEKTHGKESSKTANILMNIGSAYHKKADYLDAEKYYQSAFEIFRKVSEPNSVDFNRIYSNMGYMYRKKGDLEKALDYGLKALDIKLMNYDAFHPSVGKYYRNIGRVYEEMNHMEEALPYMQQALEITKSALGTTHPQTAGSFCELAHIYAGLQQYDTALVLYQKGTRLLEKKLPIDHPYVVAGYLNTAQILRETGKLDNALDYYRIALNRFLSRTYRPSDLIARTRNDMASTFFQQKALDSALVYCQLAIKDIAVNFSFEGNDYYKNPALGDVQAQALFLKILGTKAVILEERARQKNGDQIIFIEALNTTLLAVDLIEKMRRSYQSEISRQYLSTETAGVYKIGVRVAMALYDITGSQYYLWQAFDLAEKSKANILWRSFNESTALGAAGIPPEDQALATALEHKIGALEEELSQYEGDTNEAYVSGLRSKLFDTKLEHSRHLTYLENHFPAFFELRYAPPIVDRQQLIKKLSGDHMGLINYFYDDTDMYIFLVSKDGVQCIVKPLFIDLVGTINEIRSFDVQMLLNTGSEKVHLAYLQQLQSLYAQLIQPISSELKGVNRLVIVPYGIIHYLPFEMLIKEVNGPDYRGQPYLLYDFTIQYAWSAALWAKDVPYTPVTDQKYTGFAPSFNLPKPENEIKDTTRSSLFNLTFSAHEITDAQRLFGGQVFVDNGATKAAFKSHAPSSRILHLATHAIVDNERSLFSALAFSETDATTSDHFLYAHEVYNLKLSAEMAVMSACNTAYGVLAEGEGIMSLGRAFFYAGCRSVVMSQWPANDRTTYMMMNDFFLYLDSGQQKDKALQNAKLKHLANADALTAHPYFWAGMIAVGDMRPLPIGNKYNTLLWGLITALLAVGSLLLLRKLKV